VRAESQCQDRLPSLDEAVLAISPKVARRLLATAGARGCDPAMARFALSLLALLAGCAHALPSAPATKGRYELFVLGVAQDGGLPHLGCERSCCASARAAGRTLSPACLGVVDHRSGSLLLVEATPQIERQVAMLQALAAVHDRGRRPVDAVMVSHAHIGHYLGLAFFGREVAATSDLPLFCSDRMAAFLAGNGPWRQLLELGQLRPERIAARAPFEPLPGLQVTAIPVPHRDEYSDTMAFVLRGPDRAVLFVPDVDAWDRAPLLLDELLQGVDLAYIDGTFFDGSELPERNFAEIRHPLITDTMARLADFARAHPGAIRFIHLNHTNPALHDPAVQARIEAAGFRIAAEGERVLL
jgi:pyrroloquinoline quinone biosynthesis protein B